MQTLKLTGNKVTVPLTTPGEETGEQIPGNPPAMGELETVFVIVTCGYWGKGSTSAQAAQECRKAGAKRTAFVVGYVYARSKGDKPLIDEITVDDLGGIRYPLSAASVYLFGPSQGQMVKLGNLLKK